MMATLTTEEACRAILSLIHSDLVDFEDGFDVGDKLEELEHTDSLSSGEKALVGIAWGVWAGAGGASVGALGLIDRDNASQVLHILRARYVGTRP